MAPPQGAEEARHRLVEHQLVVRVPAPAQRQHEEVDLARDAVRLEPPDLAEVHLPLLARLVPHPAVHLRLRPPERPHHPPDRRVRDLDPLAAEVLVDLRGREPPPRQLLESDGMAVQLAGHARAAQIVRPGREAARVAAHRPRVDAQAARDLPLGHALLEQRPDREKRRHGNHLRIMHGRPHRADRVGDLRGPRPCAGGPRPGQLRSAYGLPTLPRAHPSRGGTFPDHPGGHVS